MKIVGEFRDRLRTALSVLTRARAARPEGILLPLLMGASTQNFGVLDEAPYTGWPVAIHVIEILPPRVSQDAKSAISR